MHSNSSTSVIPSTTNHPNCSDQYRHPVASSWETEQTVTHLLGRTTPGDSHSHAYLSTASSAGPCASTRSACPILQTLTNVQKSTVPVSSSRHTSSFGDLPATTSTRQLVSPMVAITTSRPGYTACTTSPCVTDQLSTVSSAKSSSPQQQEVGPACPPPSIPASHLATVAACDLWNTVQSSINPTAIVTTAPATAVPPVQKTTNLVTSKYPAARLEPLLPFDLSDDMDVFEVPAKPILKPGLLKPSRFVLPDGKCFVDKILPGPSVQLVEHSKFGASYFIQLHYNAVAPGNRGQYSWKYGTPNYLGARIPLEHTTFNLPFWRKHLIGYENIEILQYLEFGFPLGLKPQPALSPVLANHGSSYQFFPWLDKFFASGLIKGGVSGPCGSSPFQNPMVSPLMSAPKKPSDRRAVYDASYSQYSLNNSTPSDNYLGERCLYTYPKLEDFQKLILKCGTGCLLFKRDLARYFLQLPLDPTEYCYTGAIWRCLFFFFTALMFGLRHSGLQGQKVSDATAWIHRNSGLEYHTPAGEAQVFQPTAEMRNTAIIPAPHPDKSSTYNIVNYSDDFAGCESSMHKATASFKALGSLMENLGLAESVDKACSPSTSMVFLGVLFDTIKMKMSVPPEKIQELRADLDQWLKKSTAVKQNLQSILGKLFWVSRMVKHSRPFMARLLQLLRDMKDQPDTKRVPLSKESRKDLLWWSTYLRTFNGVSFIINDEDTLQSLEQLMSSPFKVYAGDATLWGGGAWYRDEYWSREFPTFLKDPVIPVHIKEFWVLVASCWVWGDDWSGGSVHLFCDNDSVCDTITYQKPRDPDLGSLLREFLYVVCSKKFAPIIRKIDTKSNFIADHISRRYDSDSAEKLFHSVGKSGMRRVSIPDIRFKLSAPW